jgi:hypothetical protein
MDMSNGISVEVITANIFALRGKKVMLDRDIAQLYGVTTRRLNEQVRRNIKRFPGDFMFRLTTTEKAELVAICDRFNSMKHSTALPYAFTEQGIAMLSGALNSDRAIMVNIQIMRAFTQLRRMLLTNQALKRKIEQMEKKYDKQFIIVFEAIKRLLEPPPMKQKRIIGFQNHDKR